MFGEICGRFLGGICGCILGIFVGGFSGVFVGRLRRPFAGTADDPTPRETEDFALRAILRRRSWWGYDCIAASRLEGILGPGCRQLKLAAWDKKRKRQWQERMRAGIKKEAFLASLEVSWFVPYRRLKPSLLPCGCYSAEGMGVGFFLAGSQVRPTPSFLNILWSTSPSITVECTWHPSSSGSFSSARRQFSS